MAEMAKSEFSEFVPNFGETTEMRMTRRETPTQRGTANSYQIAKFWRCRGKGAVFHRLLYFLQTTASLGPGFGKMSHLGTTRCLAESEPPIACLGMRRDHISSSLPSYVAYGRMMDVDRVRRCSEEFCDEPHHAKGLCHACYRRSRSVKRKRERCLGPGCFAFLSLNRTGHLCSGCMHACVSQKSTSRPSSSPIKLKYTKARPCQSDGCDRPHHARGMCLPCYAALRRKNTRNDTET